MKKLRTLIAGIVAVLMMFSVLPTYASAESPNTEAIEMLRALNIMVGDAETNAMRENDYIKRSEFAKIAVHSLGLEILTQSYKTKFPDVSDNHWAAGYIGVASEQGLIIGDPDGNFRPDDTISYREAITILVRMTGHEASALSKGGYPAGYIIEGSLSGITSNIQIPELEPLKRGMVARLTYNALQVPLMEKTGFTPPSYTVTDKTLLKDRFNSEIVTGIYSANEHTSISGSTASKGSVVLGDKEYKGIMESRLLGSRVKALVKNDGEENIVILMLMDSSKADALNVPSDAIEALNASEMIYEGARPVKLSSPVLIYNGKVENISELSVPENGSVALYDNDKNGLYDVVSITEYDNIFVSNTSLLTHTIKGKNGETLVLDPDNREISFSITDMEGKALRFADICENDILSVAKSSDGKLINAIVVRNTVNGKVTEADADSVIVNGKEYGVSSAEFPSIGTDYTLYLDACGKIAAFNKQISSDGYAYLTSVNAKDGINSKLQFSVIRANGDKVILESADKVRLNGEIAEKSDLLPLSNTLVKYLLNGEGKISSIELSLDKSENGLTYDDSGFVMNGYIENDLYKSSGKLGSIKVGENTLIFDTSADDESKYTKRPLSWLSDGSSYSAQVYDLTENLVASVLVITEENAVPSADSPILLVDKTTATLGEDGEAMLKLYGIENGEEVSLIAEADDAINALSRGDIVQYKLNSDNVVTSVSVLFDADDLETEFVRELSDSVSVLYGKPVDVFADSVNMTVGEGSRENYSLGNALIYKYDSETQSGSVMIASATDIAKYDSGSPERLFLLVNDDAVISAVIIK